jgi:hypothetical protein
MDNENNSTIDTNTDSLFNSSNNNEIDITSSTNTDSLSEIDNDIDDNILLFDNEV